ncbi:Activating transcription factor 7-interacting protein 1 [Wickerhamomyces ciferrii]|uniref:Activating transcription factor 7-interacting protein 1 n=1 Tax=Wickerhamomyces ciferrii (strain ATCC 14091 / BCRC 22168 / CBS 111 / JCM 3599 / NBRC 0793 / NRRL Y-1031 F-60-10) TaxID=1206466 RepID=K0KXR4_WICCF|nr:Activating transcription factor 7-interacting protein 1 [Wickerhamomyces ciferrii]CCH46832.1 Activating transcription factor 7-interacting protein 1 [Wickerhamomyces ciferrii]
MSAQLEKYAKSMKELSGQYESSDEEEEDEDLSDESIDEEPESKKKHDQKQKQVKVQNGKKHQEQEDDEEDEFEEWSGFEEDKEPKSKGILKRIYAASNPDHNNSKDESDDEGTTVTIENIELNNNLEEIAKLNYVNLTKSQEILDKSIDRAKKYAVIAGAEKPKKNLAQKKKKFRYLTKTERRANNRKAIESKKKSRNRD